MRCIKAMLTLALVGSTSAALSHSLPAVTPPSVTRGPYAGPHGIPSAYTVARQQYVGRLTELHDYALKLREADGGTLSPQHDAQIQTRIDIIEAAYAPYRKL